jgi:RHS repeat-associated protein
LPLLGYDRLWRRNTIKTCLPGTTAALILTNTPPLPVSTLSQTYNDLGEPETESWSGGPLAGRSVTTSWDSFGRRLGVTTSVAGFQSQNVTTYDPAGRPAIITAGSHTATYRYVANSRLRAGVTYRANGTQRLDTQYDFDRLNRLQQVLNQPSAAGQPAERHAYTYNAAQQRIRDELADGSSWNWEYDRLGQVIGGRKSWPDGSPVAGEQFEYGFDDIGNRVSQKRGGDANGANLRSTTYVVNPLNQITNRTVVGSRYLDLIGLAEPGTTVTVGGVIASRRGEFWRSELNLGTGNPLWQSVNITTSDGGSLANALYRVPPSSEVPTYDADGNLTADGLWTYTWDAENRLISMQSQALVPTAGRRKLDFEYDPLGRRIGRIVSTGASGSWVVTSTTRWLYEGWNPVAELNGAGTLVREYVWGSDLSGSWQGAGGVGGLLWVLEAPTGSNITAHYVAYDGNGNVMGLVNATDGTWSARYEYGPFGEVVRATGAMAAANPFRWSTKIQDEDSGLNYYGYRYYSAGAGRWLGRDPIGERGGLNLFGFNAGNSVNSIDLLGLQNPNPITPDRLPPASRPPGNIIPFPGPGRTPPLPPGSPPGQIIPFPTPPPTTRPIGPPPVAACVAVAIAGYKLGTVIDEAQDGYISSFWGEVAADCAEAIKEKCKKKCPPCTPYPAGTRAYQLHRVALGQPKHGPWPGDHLHWYRVNQNPTTCKCTWNKDRSSGSPWPPGTAKTRDETSPVIPDGSSPVVPPGSVQLPGPHQPFPPLFP